MEIKQKCMCGASMSIELSESQSQTAGNNAVVDANTRIKEFVDLHRPCVDNLQAIGRLTTKFMEEGKMP